MADTTNGCKSVATDTRANDFYMLYRSGNHHETQLHLTKLSGNATLDKHDLALLVLMLAQYLSDTYMRRQFLGDGSCKDALLSILETVRQNEESTNGRPNENDVDEIMMILNTSSAICDVY